MVKETLPDLVDEREGQVLATDLACRDYLPDALGCATLSEAVGKGDAFIAWLQTQDKFQLRDFLEARKDPGRGRLVSDLVSLPLIAFGRVGQLLSGGLRRTRSA